MQKRFDHDINSIEEASRIFYFNVSEVENSYLSKQKSLYYAMNGFRLSGKLLNGKKSLLLKLVCIWLEAKPELLSPNGLYPIPCQRFIPIKVKQLLKISKH